MRIVVIIGVAMGVMSCKDISLKQELSLSNKESSTVLVDQQMMDSDKTMIKDDLISVKTHQRKEEGLLLHYKYPYLNGKEHSNFNTYIRSMYLKIDQPVKEVLNAEYLSCDPSADNALRTRRSADFKIYKRDKNMISLLVYKTNYYDDPNHTSHIFKGINYDLKRGEFVHFKDLFHKGSSDPILAIVNTKLQKLIDENAMYARCSLLTTQQFALVEDNFVIDGDTVKFYFDDCTICPSYSGNHFIEVPLQELEELSVNKYL